MNKTLLLVLAAATLVPAATADARDRDHDGMGDRWEARHHASSPRADLDHDGLRNRAEFRHHTNPRDADTDNDGLDDGDEVRTHNDPRDRDSDDDGVRDSGENAGVVRSFDGTTLVIALAGGSEVSGLITGDSEIECEGPAPATARHEGDDDAVSDNSGPGSENSGSDDEDEQGEDGCGPEALTPGTVVHEAELRATAAGAWFEEVELQR